MTQPDFNEQTVSMPVFASSSGKEGAFDINLDEVFSDCFFTGGDFDPSRTQYGGKSPVALDSEVPTVGQYPDKHNESPFAIIKTEEKAKPTKQAPTMPVKMATVSTQNDSTTKMKLVPSGFAGIAAIRGEGGGPLAAVKTETQPTKKRRRRPDPRDMTEEQRVERRERNREHAKRSRIRKKFLLESLQDQLSGLRQENTNLRHLIREELPEHAADIMTSCMTQESLLLMDTDMNEASAIIKKQAGINDNGSQPHREPSAAQRGLLADISSTTHVLTEPDYRLMLNLVQAQQNFTVSDPSLPDNPIVYASEGFLKLTGYTREQVIGRNCRFLQGPKTDQKMVDQIRNGVSEGRDTSVCLLNYKADGTPFWNQFFVAALRDSKGSIVNFVGVQCEVNQVPLEIMRESAKQMAVWDI